MIGCSRHGATHPVCKDKRWGEHRIAYWTLGKRGTPLLMTSPLVFGNISLEWQIPELRPWYERLAATRTLLRFDGRNMGMSERGVRLDSRTFQQ